MALPLRILVVLATLFAATGIPAAYATCDAPAEHDETGGGACDDSDCAPGTVCPLCPCGGMIVPPAAVPSPISTVEPRRVSVTAHVSLRPPCPPQDGIFHPPRTLA